MVKKKESTSFMMDFMRFFPFWGKSVMDSIGQKYDDIQGVSIDIEENKNNMEGGKGKRKKKKKMSRKKKGGFNEENGNEGIGWMERDELERMRASRFESPPKQGINQKNKSTPKKRKYNRVEESPTTLNQRLNLTNPGEGMVYEGNVPIAPYGRVERRLAPNTPPRPTLIKTPKGKVNIGTSESERFLGSLRKWVGEESTPSPSPLRPPSVHKNRFRQREEPSTLASRTSILHSSPLKRNRRRRNENDEENENEEENGNVQEPNQRRVRIEEVEEEGEGEGEGEEENEATQVATQPASPAGGKKKSKSKTQKRKMKK